MPTLHWIWKDKIVNHHQEIPYRVLKHKYGFSSEKWEQEDFSNTWNKIIRWDNLEALKSLLPEYEGKIKCIYIDPPYNTWNEKWVYNDNVNHPKIKKWLWEVVGKEAEDLTRHDKWLCMMYPRLKLLHKLLSNDWVIMVSLADHAQWFLRLILDEIFWENNFVAQFVWHNDWNIDNQSKIKINHEYIITYSKNINFLKKPNIIDPNIEENSKLYNEQIENSITKNWPKNPPSSIEIPVWFPANFEEWEIQDRSDVFPYISEKIIVKNFEVKNNFFIESWWSSKNLLVLFINNWFSSILDQDWKETSFYLTSTWAIYCIKKRSDEQWHVLSIIRNVWTTKQTSNFLKKLDINFNYPKPPFLIEYLLKIFVWKDKKALILDSFAWSWTTWQAVLSLNKDWWNRKFILTQIDELNAETWEFDNLAEDLTSKRIKGIIKWFDWFEWLWGWFDFYELWESFFVDNEQKILNEEIWEDEMKKYIYYTETWDYLYEKTVWKNKYFMGKKYETWYYFYYEKDEITYLDEMFLVTITEKTWNYLIYADVCNLSESFMRKHNVLFKKIPRDITKI